MSEETVSVGSVVERLRALEGKLAAAVGPHVALDREIAEAIGLNVHFDTFLEKPMVLETTEWGARISHDIKPYTSSIDAALTLLPEGWCSGHEDGGKFDRVAGTLAWAWPADSYFEPDWQNGHQGYRDAPDGFQAVHTVRTIAMCIVALRARGGVAHG